MKGLQAALAAHSDIGGCIGHLHPGGPDLNYSAPRRTFSGEAELCLHVLLKHIGESAVTGVDDIRGEKRRQLIRTLENSLFLSFKKCCLAGKVDYTTRWWRVHAAHSRGEDDWFHDLRERESMG
jgi:hypothetical protein